MAYPDQLLADDERVVMDLRPHWKALVIPVLVLLAVAGLGSYAIAAMPSGEYQQYGRIAVLAAAVLALLAFTVVPFLRWRTTRFIVTSHRVLFRSGVLARRGRDVPLARVNDVTFSHSLLERLLGCGTLVVESAGERGQVVLSDIPRVERVQRELYRLVESDDNRRRRGQHDVDRDGVI